MTELLTEAGAVGAPTDPVDELLAACMRADEVRVQSMLTADAGAASAAVARDPARIARASELGRPDADRLLARIGFDVNYTERVTPLHIPAYAGDRAMVDLLVQLGADPTIRDDDFDATPAGWARHAHHDELAHHLADLEIEVADR